MIVTLFVAICLAYSPDGECIDSQVLPAQQWTGLDAKTSCQIELAESLGRLEERDLAKHFTLYCE